MALRVLIADDDRGVRDLLTTFLSKRGCKVDTVEDGVAALEAVRQSRHDLMLLDIYLPKVSGLDVLHEMRAEGIGVDVITMSGLPDERMLRDCLALGAADFLPKPLNFPRLEEQVLARQIAHASAL